MENKNLSTKISTLSDYVLGAGSLAAIIIITMGVVCRFVLKMSITWSDELLRTLFIYCYFIGTAVAYKEIGLMRLEILDAMLLKKKKYRLYKLLLITQGVCESAFFGVIAYYSYVTISAQIQTGQTTTTSSTPAWVATAGFAIGMFLLFVFAIYKIAKTIKAKPWENEDLA